MPPQLPTRTMWMMMIKFGAIHRGKYGLLPRLAEFGDVHMKYVKVFNKRVTEKQLRAGPERGGAGLGWGRAAIGFESWFPGAWIRAWVNSVVGSAFVQF